MSIKDHVRSLWTSDTIITQATQRQKRPLVLRRNLTFLYLVVYLILLTITTTTVTAPAFSAHCGHVCP